MPFVSSKITWKRIWHFIWDEDSFLSWVVNIILAFVLIKFIIYPGLGLVLATTHPVVAVVSGSMEHDGSFDTWWDSPACPRNDCRQGDFYARYNITRGVFESFPFKNGFNTGDIMILYGTKPERIQVGDILVFKSSRPDPIIHRVVYKWEANGTYYFQTKGDHNPYSLASSSIDETSISEKIVVGRAVLRLPYLGWIKLGFVNLIAAISSLK